MATGTANYGAGLPAYDSKELQVLFGTYVSNYTIEVYRKEMNTCLFLDIDMDVDLCRTITYICDDNEGVDMSDGALDGYTKTKELSMPRIKTFSGFCKGGFKFKLAVEQLECIWQQEILMNWFNQQLNKSIENGRTAIMARFYRTLIANVHPKNTGNNAGQVYGGQVIGTPRRPVLFDPANADNFMLSMNSVMKQMPKAYAHCSNEYARGLDGDFFMFGPSIMENVLAQTDAYMRYDSIGSCNACSFFKDVFDKHPRGIIPVTGDCIESYTCQSGGASHTVYPILFGKRYLGAKAALRIKSHNWMTDDQQTVYYQTMFYSHIHVYDPRFLGLAYIVIDQKQPQTIDSCEP